MEVDEERRRRQGRRGKCLELELELELRQGIKDMRESDTQRRSRTDRTFRRCSTAHSLPRTWGQAPNPALPHLQKGGLHSRRSSSRLFDRLAAWQLSTPSDAPPLHPLSLPRSFHSLPLLTLAHQHRRNSSPTSLIGLFVTEYRCPSRVPLSHPAMHRKHTRPQPKAFLTFLAFHAISTLGSLWIPTTRIASWAFSFQVSRYPKQRSPVEHSSASTCLLHLGERRRA